MGRGRAAWYKYIGMGIDLPLMALPLVVRAGRYDIADRAFETRYRGGSHALHLHDYAGRM